MTHFKNNLMESLDSEITVQEDTQENAVVEYKTSNSQNRAMSDEDYQMVRNNLIQLQEIGREALEEALEVAKESDQPRSFEVFSGLLKNLADVNKDILDIKKKIKDIYADSNSKNYGREDEYSKSTTNIENAIFVGTTTDLQRKMKEINEEETTIDHE